MTLGKIPRRPGAKLGHRKTPVVPVSHSELEKPDWLTPIASAYWDETAPILKGVACRSDSTAFALLCETYSTWRTAMDVVAREGATVAGSAGTPIVSPSQRVVNTSFDQLIKLMAKFGMTPQSKRSVPPMLMDKDNPWLRLVSNHAKPTD